MKKQPIIITMVCLLIGLVIYGIYNLEWEYVEHEVGLSEEAMVEPLLAAKTFLLTKDINFQELERENDFFKEGKITLTHDTAFIIDEAALAEYKNIESALLNWVREGGHLVYLLSPRRDMLTIKENTILTQANINVLSSEDVAWQHAVTSAPVANIEYIEDNIKQYWYIPYNFYFTNCEGEAFYLIETENTVLCDLAIQDGFITFITSVHQISNASLKYLDHGEFLLWLVGAKTKLVYLPSLHSTNWLIYLWRWSSLVIILAALSIICIMWHFSIRLGLAKTPLHLMKSTFANHIEANGNFMIKHEYYQHLKQALITDLERVMELRSPMYKSLTVAEQAKLLSQITGKNKQTIEQLLTQELPVDEAARVKFVRTFKELRKAL